jgi:hypothetical protein
MDLINALDAWKTGKIDPDTGSPVSLLRVFSDKFSAGTEYDTIDITYPTTTKEVYTYTLSAASVRVVTVDYVDSTKDNILKVVYS